MATNSTTAVREGPLSYSQEGLWLLNQLEPSGAYNNVLLIRFEGPLRLDVLGQCLDDIVRRHETLRTTFGMVGGRPVQWVGQPYPLALPVIELPSGDANSLEEALRQAALEGARPFDLSEAPPVRASVIRVAPEDHLLVISIHHIVSDGGSITVLMTELVTLYETFVRGQPSPFEPPPLQYLDFVLRQRERMSGGRLEAGIDYWTQQLTGSSPLLDLPTDHARPPVQSHRGAVHTVHLPSALVERLRELGRSHGATLFMVLLAAFQAFLYRYTGQDDISVGTPMTHRSRRDLQGMIGYLTNTLVMRSRPQGDLTFIEFLARVRTAAKEAYAHADVPFERVVQAIRPPRLRSQHPLFQVLLSFNERGRTLHLARFQISDLSVTFPQVDQGTARFDLALCVHDIPGSLGVDFEYSTDLFDPVTVIRMASHFMMLLRGVARAPSTQLAALPLLTRGERARLISSRRRDSSTVDEAARAGTTGSAIALSFVEEFANHARLEPNRVALVEGSRVTTYGELLARSEQLASEPADGAMARSPVGAALRGSLDRLASLLGTIRDGGTRGMDDPSPDRAPGRQLPWGSSSADLPLIMGSFGVDQAALAASLSWATSPGSPFADREFIVLAGPIPDQAWIVAALAQLAQGGEIVVTGVDPPRWPAAKGSTTVVIPDESVSHWLRQPSDEPGEEFVVVLGEPPLAGQLRRWCGRGGDRRFFALYAPEEMGGPAALATCDLTGASYSGRIIGKGVAGKVLYVLDERLRPVPPGVPGRLHVGGVVARAPGWDPKAHADRVVPDPFLSVAGASMVMTDDLARWRSDGDVELLGDVDGVRRQVDGFRVLPCIVEGALAMHPVVEDAWVRVEEGEDSRFQLVAAVVAEAGTFPLSQDLVLFLRRALARYMVPSSVEVLPRLPRDSTGRLDRRAALGSRKRMAASTQPSVAELALGALRHRRPTRFEE